MSWIAWRIIAPVARALGINLNWIFDPWFPWQRRKPFWIGRRA
ncbi:hypothetical protein [Szabonella alba]|nr:hypothetical protein [Szabonella alba]